MPFTQLLVPTLMACLLFSFKSDKKPARVVFFGDSITEAGVFPGGYIAQLRDSLLVHKPARPLELIGSGIGGNKIYDLYLRHETDVLERKPKVVVLYVGVNDVWHKLLFGTGTDADKFQKFYLALIDKFEKKKIRVIVCTPACIGERHIGQNQLDADLDQYSDIIRKIALQKKVPLCDFRSAFQRYSALHNPENLDKGILTTDGVHLNEKGNALLAEILMNQLQIISTR